MKKLGSVAWLCVLLSANAFSACLPADTRPPPARALVRVVPSESLLQGIAAEATADGWAIRYERFLIGVGRAELGGERCTEYADADYSRIFDMLQPEPQKLSEQFALGSCELDFGIVNPSGEALLGAGVSSEDAVFMRTPGNDDYATNRGISLYVEGRAEQGGVEKRFAWTFRWQVAYEDCGAERPGVPGALLELEESGEETVDLLIAGEALFQTSPVPDRAELRFGPLADADTLTGNGDGAITFDELGQVQLADLPAELGYELLGARTEVPLTPEELIARAAGAVDPRELPSRIRQEPTLQDHLYVGVYPSVARFRGTHRCETHLRARFFGNN